MERDLTTLRYQAASTGTGTLAVTIEELNAVQRALDAEREKVKRLSTRGTDHSTPWWQVKCEDSEAQLATLQAQLADRDAMILQMGEQAAVLAKENMAVKAQLRQVEGERGDYRLMYMSLTGETYDNPLSRAHNELSTLRQVEGERDRLTQQLHTLYAKHPEDSCYGAMPKLRAEVANLRQLVEALPHTDLCAVHQDLLDGGPGDCNCFKSRATLLSAAGKQMEVK